MSVQTLVRIESGFISSNGFDNVLTVLITPTLKSSPSNNFSGQAKPVEDGFINSNEFDKLTLTF